MPRTQISYDNQHKVRTILIDGKDINDYVGRPIALNLHNNNQEIEKALADTMAVINDFTAVVDIAFSEHPDARDANELKQYYEEMLNIVGFFFLRVGEVSGMKAIYQRMLQTLKRFDSYVGIPLHKGMTFHNIAISQLIQRNFDQAISNSLRATDQDVRAGTPIEQSFSRKILESQYTQPILDNMKTSTSEIFQQMTGTQLGSQITDLMKQLEPAAGLFLVQIWKSLEVNQPRDNLYSPSRAS